MNKVIYFDLDGTIADLYAVEGWLNALRNFEPWPYRVAKPMWDFGELKEIFHELKELGYIIGIITWLSKESSREYDNAVRAAKREWLKEQGLWECFDEVHMVKYGTPKHTTANIRHGILVDDNAEVREAWERYGGETIDPTAEDILNIFRAMIEEEEME